MFDVHGCAPGRLSLAGLSQWGVATKCASCHPSIVRPRSLCLLVVSLCAVSLVGCSEDDPGEQAGDIALWLDQAPSAVQDDGDELAVLASLVEQGEEAGGDEISATFKEPVTIRRVELECFGDGLVEGLFGLTSAAGAVDTTSARASCAEGVLELDIPESSREGVTKVSFSSVASTEKGAWRVTVR